MTISNKLQELLDIKQDIKVAIENKGGDLTDVDFGGYARKIDDIQTGGSGLTGGYNIVYRSDYYNTAPSWISITITFVDDTTANHLIKHDYYVENLPDDWEHFTGVDDIAQGGMTWGNGPYVWGNVKSVSIGVHAYEGEPYLKINGENVGKTYNATLDKNILVENLGGDFSF